MKTVSLFSARISSFFVAIIFLATTAVAQPRVVTQEKGVADPGTPYKPWMELKFAGFDDTGYYTWQFPASTSPEYFLGKMKDYGVFDPGVIRKFDKNLIEQKSLTVDFGTEMVHFRPQTMLNLKGKMYLFYSYSEQKSQLIRLAYRLFDPVSFKIEEKETIVVEYKIAQLSGEEYSEFTIDLSKDSSKVAIYNKFFIPVKLDVRFQLHVFDSDMNQLWNQQYTLPLQSGLFKLHSMRVDNKGDVYTLIKQKKNYQDEIDYMRPNYAFKFYAFTGDHSQAVEKVLVLKEYLLLEPKLDILTNGDVACVGTYTASNVINTYGAFTAVLDSDSKNFNYQLLQPLKTMLGKMKELYVYPGFQINDIIPLSNGSAYLIGEFKTSYPAATVTNSSYMLHLFSELAVFSMDQNGKLTLVQRVNKNQGQKHNSRFLSYAIAVSPENIYLFFNDMIENQQLEKGDDGRRFALSGEQFKDLFCVSYVTLNNLGTQPRKALISPEQYSGDIIPKTMFQVADDTYLLIQYHGKEQKILKIIIE